MSKYLRHFMRIHLLLLKMIILEKYVSYPEVVSWGDGLERTTSALSVTEETRCFVGGGLAQGWDAVFVEISISVQFAWRVHNCCVSVARNTRLNIYKNNVHLTQGYCICPPCSHILQLYLWIDLVDGIMYSFWIRRWSHNPKTSRCFNVIYNIL